MYGILIINVHFRSPGNTNPLQSPVLSSIRSFEVKQKNTLSKITNGHVYIFITLQTEYNVVCKSADKDFYANTTVVKYSSHYSLLRKPWRFTEPVVGVYKMYYIELISWKWNNQYMYSYIIIIWYFLFYKY